MSADKLITTERVFPESTIATVSQNGHDLSVRRKGVRVLLHRQPDKTMPFSAEVMSLDQSEYVDIGLEFEGKTLIDYDGVFELPREVAWMLVALDYTVPGANLAELDHMVATVPPHRKT